MHRTHRGGKGPRPHQYADAMRDLGVGFGYLIKGQRWVGGHGRWFGFGLLPGLITLVLYAAALVGLGYGADNLVTWATPSPTTGHRPGSACSVTP